MASSDFFPNGGSPPEDTKLRAVIPSDELPRLREFLSMSPLLQQVFGDLLQLRIVLDADIVQKELTWRLSKRRNPRARTALHEAIDSGIIVAFAPAFLEQEIQDHIDEIASRAKVPVSAVSEEWQQFKPRLNFYDPEPPKQPDPDCVDPDDLSYKWVCEQLGAHAIYSTDTHFQKMSVPLISVQLDLTVRDYARANSVKLTINIGATCSVIIGFGALIGVCHACVQILKQLPTPSKLLLAAGVILAIVHPKLRAKIADLFQEVRSQFDGLTAVVGSVFGELLIESAEADIIAKRTYAEIQTVLPAARKVPALARARRICLTSKEPLSLQEIEARIFKEGHVSSSRNFTAYLRRLLRKEKRFVEVSPGLWTLRAERLSGID